MTDIAPALIVFLFPLAFSPGPGNLFFAALGARGGLVATGPAMLGYHVVTWGLTVAMGLGAAGVAQTAPAVPRGLQIAGGLYLLYVAIGLWRADPVPSDGSNGPGLTFRRAGVVTGAALLLLNPKAYVIIALMFAHFADAARHPAEVMWIATVFTLNNLVAFTLWSVLGARLAMVCGDGTGARWLNATMAASLAGVALWMLAR